MALIQGSVTVGGFIAPSDSTDAYAVTDELYNRGGYRTVPDLAARDLITTDRRKLGMLVYVLSEDKFYTLKTDLNNSSWQEAKLGSAGVDTSQLATVATTGNYNDLNNKPTIPTNTNQLVKTDVYTKTEVDNFLSQKAGISSNISATSITGLATVATTGNYNDLSNKPIVYLKTEVDSLLSNKMNTVVLATVATSGNYNDLSNKPTIPVDTSQLTKTDIYTKAEIDVLHDDISNDYTTLLANKSDINHTHPELHTHANINVLDNIVDDNGMLSYNGATLTIISDGDQSETATWSGAYLYDQFLGKSDINHTHAQLHTHLNASVLLNLSDVSGQLYYAGSPISNDLSIDDTTVSESSVWSSQNTNNWLLNKSNTNHTHPEYVHSNLAVLNKMVDVNGLLQYNGNIVEGVKIQVRDTLLAGTAFELREGSNVKLDLAGNVITISSISAAGSGSSYNDVNYYQQSELGVIATPDTPNIVSIPVGSGSYNFMPIAVFKKIVKDDTSIWWRKAKYTIDYEYEYDDTSTNLNVLLFSDGDYKISYAISTSVSSNADVVFDGGEF